MVRHQINLTKNSIKNKIPFWGSKISCAELHFVPVPRSWLRGASITELYNALFSQGNLNRG